VTFAVLFGVYRGWGGLAPLVGDLAEATRRALRLGVGAGAWLAGAWLLTRLVEAVFWDRFVARRLGGAVPALLKSVGAVVVFLLACGGFIGVTLGYSVTGFWATSSVVGIIVGLALQSMIADVFSGIAINVDRPFAIGDWVRLQPRGSNDPITGQVVEVSWRATRLRTIDNVTHVVPNNLLSLLVVTNLSLPEPTSRFELKVCVDFSVASERVLRILNAAVRSVEGVLEDPAPKARIDDVGRDGVVYHVHYWLRPDVVSPHKGRHLVSESILQNLAAAGIALAHPKQDLHVGAMRRIELDLDRDRVALVKRIALFESLEDDEVAGIAATMGQRRFEPGDLVIERDADGDSMFFVVEGLLEVLVPVEGREDLLRVGQMAAGDFFGEMSLLTGAPRSATVRALADTVAFEITRDDIHELVTGRPDVARRISRIVAERQAEGASARDRAATPHSDSDPTATVAEKIFARISGFFSGGRHPHP
jgi:small-conductance mechanosensitive channel/CRP-like cAMP-binding protein